MKKWNIKKDSIFKRNIKSISKKLAKRLFGKIKKLRIDPYIGKQLRPPYSHLWEIYVNGFRLYYEIWEKQKTILLKAFFPKRLQKRYLKGKVRSG